MITFDTWFADEYPHIIKGGFFYDTMLTSWNAALKLAEAGRITVQATAKCNGCYSFSDGVPAAEICKKCSRNFKDEFTQR